MNAKMSELIEAFEHAGFSRVRTVLSSGNVVFDARRRSEASLERAVEAAMSERLGRDFFTVVRPIDSLHELLASDPYREFTLEPSAKWIVTFMRTAPDSGIRLPIERDGARLLSLHGREIIGAYVPSSKWPAFMSLIERTFGKMVTTRTWERVGRIART